MPQPKAVSDISNFLKSMKTVDLKTIQTCNKGKTKQSSWIETILGKINLKGGSKNFQKYGKTVAAATIGDYPVNLDL